MRLRAWRALWAAAFALACSGSVVRSLWAQTDTTDTVERRARRARQGAGIRVGIWNVPDIAGGTNSSWPMFEGYFQKGLDQHLVIETSAGVWRRQIVNSSGTERAFAVPMLTQLKLYPATTPEINLEPYLAGGIGLTLGVDQNQGAAGGLLGGGSGGGTATVVGIGFKGSGGVEYRLGRAFGIAGYVGYQYVYFLDKMVGVDSFKGLVIGGGLTYRYQF